MLRIRRIEITNFVCFDRIEIEPSMNPDRRLTVIRAENGSGKTTLLRAIRWGMYGEEALPGNRSAFSLHPASWRPEAQGVPTTVCMLFETDGSSRHHLEGNPANTEYELRRTVTTVGKEPRSKGEPDFQRIDESVQLLRRQSDGSWIPQEHGAGRVIDELLPWDLRDFFVMDADEAADFVGGSENKLLRRQEVIGKTSFAVRALLGLEVFDNAAIRVESLQQKFGREATKATRNAELQEKQAELDRVSAELSEVEQRLVENRHKKQDLSYSLSEANGDLEAMIGNLGVHDELKRSMADNHKRTERASEQRPGAAKTLSRDLTSIDLLASLAARELTYVEADLQPLYDDGSIPLRHLGFVQRLLEAGVCVCGQDLSSPGEHANRIRQVIDASSGQEDHAQHLAETLHAAKALARHRNGEAWERRTTEHADVVSQLDEELADLAQARRENDARLKDIDDEQVETGLGRSDMLKGNLDQLQ